MPVRPSNLELEKLREVLLEHAIGKRAPEQCKALRWIFDRVIGDESLEIIQPAELVEFLHPDVAQEINDPNVTVYSLVRDIRAKLDAFYGEGKSNGKRPNHQSLHVEVRVDFVEKRNYMLKFPSYTPKRQEADLVPFFWEPHLPPAGMAHTLYCEPFFLIDKEQTYFRNSKMGTEPDKSKLDYLKIPGKLETGYSYVPAGIVKAMVILARTLRPHDQNWPNFQYIEEVKPRVSEPPGSKDLIL